MTNLELYTEYKNLLNASHAASTVAAKTELLVQAVLAYEAYDAQAGVAQFKPVSEVERWEGAFGR